MVARRTPEWPRARLAAFSTRIRRTIGSGKGAPMPHMCESTRRRCSSSIWSGGDADARELAEAGVDAIDRGIARRHLGHQIGRRLDPGPAGLAQGQAMRPRHQAVQPIERQRTRRQGDGGGLLPWARDGMAGPASGQHRM